MTTHRSFLIIALLLLGAGFVLRLLLYDYHGLEGDDAFSLALSRYEVGDLLAGLARLEYDIHPPLHFLALKGWTTLTGESLLSLRLMNILVDLLTGTLLLRLTGRVFKRRAALAAGGLWIVAPLLIYSTYLIRMYSLLALFTTAGVVCIMEAAWSQRRARWYANAALCGLLAAYTHIVGGLVLVALAVGAVVDAFFAAPRTVQDDRKRREGVLTIAAFALAGLLYLPFFNTVWSLYRSGRPLGAEIAEASFGDPLSALSAILTALLAHRALNSPLVGLLLVALLLIGSLILARCDRRTLPLISPMWVGLVGMSGLAWLAGMYKARYLVPFVPLLLALAAGMLLSLSSRRHQHGWEQYAAALLLITFVGVSLTGVAHDLNRDFRDDWVAAARFVRQHERPGDAIIVIPDWGQEAFKFHYHGSAPVTGVLPRVSDDVDLDSILAPLTAAQERVWLVSYQPIVADPEGHAPLWFSSHSAALLTEAFPAGMHIRAFDFAPRVNDLPTDVRVLEAQFGTVLALRGAFLPVTQGSAHDTRLHPPSNWVQVTLYWEALRPDVDATSRVRFTDTIGQTYGAALERPDDLLRRIPVSTWQPGEWWRVTYDLNLNPQTPPGVYHIEVMVLDSTGNPLPASGVDAGDSWVITGQFIVE